MRQADHIALTPLDLEEYLASRHFEASVVVLVMGSVSQLLDLTVDGPALRFMAAKVFTHTSVGADGFRPRELRLLPDEWFDGLAVLFNYIVANDLWPSLLLISNVALIPKSEEAKTAADLRPITIFSLLYRLWSSSVSKQIIVTCDSCGFFPEGIK